MILCHHFKLPRQICLLALLLILALLGAGTAFLLGNYYENLIQERQEKTRKMVENAYSLLAYYQGKVEKGEVPAEKAKRYAIETIRQLLPEPNGYFWIVDTHPYGVMHPIKTPWEGEDLSAYVGPDGKKLFVDVAHIAQTSGEGFVDYLWSKPDRPDGGFFPKTSFVKLFGPWRWIIGTGVYIDDINAAFWNAVGVACGLIVAVLTFLLALGVTISESLRKSPPVS